MDVTGIIRGIKMEKVLFVVVMVMLAGCEVPEQNERYMKLDSLQISATEEDKELDAADYSAYLKKIWIVDEWESGGDYPVSLVLTGIEKGNGLSGLCEL